MNAVMLAAACNNHLAFGYFYDRADSLDFDWNCRNHDGWNLADLSRQRSTPTQIRLQVDDLLSRQIIDPAAVRVRGRSPRTAHRAHVRLPPVLGCHPSLPSNAGTMMRLPARTPNPQEGRRSSRFVPSWSREPRQQIPGCGRTVTRPSRRLTERSLTYSAAHGMLAASLRGRTTLLI